MMSWFIMAKPDIDIFPLDLIDEAIYALGKKGEKTWFAATFAVTLSWAATRMKADSLRPMVFRVRPRHERGSSKIHAIPVGLPFVRKCERRSSVRSRI